MVGTLTPEKLQELQTWQLEIYNLYDVVDKGGGPVEEFNYEKCFRVTSMTIGRIFTNINTLLLQEKLNLEVMEAQQKINKRNALYKSKTEPKFNLETRGEVETWIAGDPVVNEQEKQIKQVKALIDYLQNCLDQSKFFSGNIKNLLEIRKQKNDMYGV
jgi:hypothetical protein